MAEQIEEFKTSEKGDLFMDKEAAAAVYGFVTQFLGGLPQLADMYNEFKKGWPEIYFEGLSDSPITEAYAEDVEGPTEGGEVVEGEVASGY
ncbi:hypothetical protein LIER_36129 [Lithospermum erythrorhizon]|uniref:Uncharacterized protein n=1 Tax=Lithospermum erythrorhizon TaxID=34254 RepID=A0AAV3P256_LITER